VIKTIIEDQRIGSSHSTVNSERGFGGHCLPKDVSAIIRSAQRNNTRLTLLEEAINYNNSIRKGKD
jgi:UDPglucose 6-dehydrogenase